MADQHLKPSRKSYERITLLSAILLIIIGALSWAAWVLRIDFLLQPFPLTPATKANEAICWTLLGLSLLAAEVGLRRLAAIALIPMLISGITLLEYLLVHDFGIDEFITRDFLLIETAYPGRMAPIAAVCILMGSLVMVWRVFTTSRMARHFAEAVSGSLISSVGFSTILGYIISLPAVYRWGSTTAASLVSGACLIILGFALLMHAWRASLRLEGAPPMWAPVPPVITFFTLTIILWIGMRERELLYIGTNTQGVINSYGSNIEFEWRQIASQLEDQLVAPNEHASTVPTPQWERDAERFLDSKRALGCQAVHWIDPDWKTILIYPSKGNEANRGFNHASDEARAMALRNAQQRHRTSFSQTIVLPGLGTHGFAVYAPVFHNADLVGYIGADFSYRGFFSAIDQKLEITKHYDSLLSINSIPAYGNLPADRITESGLTLELSMLIQERRFRIVLSPNENNLQYNRRHLPELTLVSGLSITLILGLAVHFFRTARAGLLAAEEYNRRLTTENEERRRIDERLKTSDERLRLALDSTGIGIFEWNLATGYVYYSAGLWILLGYEPSRMSAAVDALQSLIHPEDLPGYRRRTEAQVSGTTQFIDPEFRVRTRSGDWRWLYLRAKSVQASGENTPRRIIGTIQDVTARREAEDALRASQAATRKLSLVASRTDNLVVIFSPEGRVEWVNEAFVRAMEYPLSEIVGKKATEFLSGPDTDPRTIGRIKAAITLGQGISTDLVQYSKSGRKYHLSFDIQPVRNRSSEIENFIAVASDITARVDTEHALRRAKSEADAASRAKSEFLASMSHEIRTPMNGVIGMTSLLLDTGLTQEQREFVNTIRSSGESLLSIINDILDFSKIESGHMELERLSFNLPLCIEESIELFAVQAFAKHLELVFHIDRQVPQNILGDVTRLRQVLINLINNAVKFTAHGSISVEVRLAPDDPVELGVPPGRILIEFRVQDTGIGIPPDRLHRLFKVFSQVDSSTTRKFGGTGLGLAICERLCTLMGGSIRVESTQGVGSCFIFTIQTEPGNPADLELLPNPPAPIAKAPVIALIPNPVGQRRLHSLLSTWGVNVLLASTEEEALQLAGTASMPPPLLMVDYTYSHPLECLPRLTQIHAPRLICLPFGFSPPEVPADGFSYYFITKPLRAHTLYQTIINIFALPVSRSTGSDAVAPREPVLGELIPLDILLVEDNPVNQKVAQRFLERLGYRARAAHNGLEALSALDGQHFHLVIMDLQMPEMDGLEASRQIRMRLPPERQPKIIALTANALKGDRELCMAAGMDDYVAKPIRMHEIADAIRRQFPRT